MRYYLIFPLLCSSLLLCACNNYERENRRFSEEIRVAREENDYLKAQIVGLRKELDELSTKVKAEREGLERKFEENRRQLETKFQEQTEAMLKKAAEASKKNMEGKKETKDSASKIGQARTNDGKAQLPKGAPKE